MDIEIEAREILRMRDLLNGILKHHTGLSDEQILKYTDRNFYMTPTTAKELGVIDDVLIATPQTSQEKKPVMSRAPERAATLLVLPTHAQ